MQSLAEAAKKLHLDIAAKYSLRGIGEGSVEETATMFLQLVNHYSQADAFDWLWHQVLSQLSFDQADFVVERLDLYAAKQRVGL